jgi:hypothetical protein
VSNTVSYISSEVDTGEEGQTSSEDVSYYFNFCKSVRSKDLPKICKDTTGTEVTLTLTQPNP